MFTGVFAVLSTVASAVLSEAVSGAQIRSSLNGSTLEFDSFRKTFHRQYEGSGDEFKRRLLSFQEAAVRHTHLNSFSTEPQSATYGINQFSDLSQEEFRDIYLQAIGVRAPPFSGLPTEGLPARFDWRDKAVVAPVQDQLAVSFILKDVRSTDQLIVVMSIQTLSGEDAPAHTGSQLHQATA